MKTISAIILTKNEENMIKDCLASLSFCDEIILIDSNSVDKTVSIAKQLKAIVFTDDSSDFSQKRNLGLQKATSDWIMYVDADERVSPLLRDSIQELLKRDTTDITAAYKLKRKNYYLGEHGWPQVENMERLFQTKALKGWKGALHESPEITGQIGTVDGYLLHYTHRDLTTMVTKTNQWSQTEAELRLHAKHPAMSWWRFPRVMSSAFVESYFRQGGYKVGTAGLIESIYQSFSAFITYAKLWEMQQKKH